ncbi:alpha/beta-type small acid-soluble spore protein [Clostridium felsineum]|uniref:alpha/beta-type small acid-soluble spore protein n=1 Tax=Clostridium felsineum TaxID=36839 RepID=UPI00098BD897|nr:alpha/beta-type small acid-soluble spore protein [Clostridium felsineum]MCR3761310.1 alpha/beta-type small acid-soluble spore protein [Clostridium felsineum]URZ00478.1 hypothetical protein CLAUR_004660 [Clostridium felsineum]
MANYNKKLVPEGKEKLNIFKMEAANDIGINLKFKYGCDLTSKEAGSIGGKIGNKKIQRYNQKYDL